MAGPKSDKVTLNGQDFYIKGPVRGEALSEFEDGFKIGKTTYDTRENAFFFVIDDASGGFGHRRLDVQDNLGTFWDSDRTNSPDLSRKGHITLAWPQQGLTTITAPIANKMAVRNPSMPSWFMPDGTTLTGFGNRLYKWNGGVTFLDVGGNVIDAGGLESIVEYVESDGTITHWAFFMSASNSLSGGRYMKSLDGGATWVNGAKDYVLQDAIFWDNKIIAAYGKSIIFGTVTAGVETWNIDAATDGQKITSVSHGNIHFMGVAEAPFGQPAVYFTDEDNLWVLDFYARACYRIDVGLASHRITASCQWRGNFYMSDGWNIQEYDPSTRQVKNIGFPRKDGIPATLRSSSGNLITLLIPSEGSLMAVMLDLSGPQSTLWQYLGKGWSQVGGQFAIFSNTGFQSIIRATWTDLYRKIHIIGASTLTALETKVESFDVPAAGHVPVVGIDSFGASGANFTTGWIDGGFLDLNGAALRMYCDAFSLTTTETIKVEYQLDNAESSSWVQLRNSSDVASVFDNSTNLLYFHATDPLKGIQFRTIRFKITLNRGGDATKSPELRALTFVYFKKPSLRTGWTFTVDVQRMVNEGLVASYQAAYNLLAATWATQTLVDFSIPNIKTGMRVMLNHIKVSVDNIRTQKSDPGDGDIEVSLLEPVI